MYCVIIHEQYCTVYVVVKSCIADMGWQLSTVI